MQRRAAILGAGLLLVSRGAARAQGRELVVGSVYPAGHHVTTAVQGFSNKVDELTAGKVSVVHLFSGALGDERELAQAVQRGALDFTPSGVATLSSFAPELSVFGLPYLFRDYLHLFGAVDAGGPLRSYCERALALKGFTLVALLGAGYHAIAGPDPVNGPADLRGKKLRVLDDRETRAIFLALGATPLAIPLPEVRAALQSKAVDFTEGSLADFLHRRVYEVVKHVTDVRHLHQVVALVASRKTWSRMDAATRRAVLDAARSAEAANRKGLVTEDNLLKDQLRGKGMTITKPDPAPFRAVTAHLYSPFIASAGGAEGRGVLQSVLALR